VAQKLLQKFDNAHCREKQSTPKVEMKKTKIQLNVSSGGALDKAQEQRQGAHKELYKKQEGVSAKYGYNASVLKPSSKQASRNANTGAASEIKVPKQLKIKMDSILNPIYYSAQNRKLNNSPCVRNDKTPSTSTPDSTRKPSPALRSQPLKIVENVKVQGKADKPIGRTNPQSIIRKLQADKPRQIVASKGGLKRTSSGEKERVNKNSKAIIPKAREKSLSIERKDEDKNKRSANTNKVVFGPLQKKNRENEKGQDECYACRGIVKTSSTNRNNISANDSEQEEVNIKMVDPISQDRDRLIAYNKQCIPYSNNNI
jgi:hypothetical protein